MVLSPHDLVRRKNTSEESKRYMIVVGWPVHNVYPRSLGEFMTAKGPPTAITCVNLETGIKSGPLELDIDLHMKAYKPGEGRN